MEDVIVIILIMFFFIHIIENLGFPFFNNCIRQMAPPNDLTEF